MIPASISTGLTAFQAAVTAAKPIAQAPALQVAALIVQGNALLSSLDALIASSGSTVEAGLPFTHPLELPALLNGVVAAADELRVLHDMRGFLGRAVFNLKQGGTG